MSHPESGPDPWQPEQRLPPFDPAVPLDYPAGYPDRPWYPPPPYPAAGQYPYPYPYGDPYRPPTPPGTNGKAITSLVCGITGVVLCICLLPSLAAIIFGIIAMTETRRTGQDGYGIAVAGLVLGVITVAVGVLLLMVRAGAAGF